MHLISVLSNFESPQFERVAGAAVTAADEARRSRQELRDREVARGKALVERYQSGETVKALAAEFGMHHATVRAVLRAADVGVRTRRRLTDEQLVEIRELYAAGKTTTEIGERFDVYASTIQRQLLKLGITMRSPGWRTTG